MKLFSWNVNGVRAAERKGFLNWFSAVSPDVVCLQETKATLDQVSEDLIHPFGFHSFWHSAKKLGYSGTCVYTKTEPLRVLEGIQCEEIDREGRVLTLEFPRFYLVNAYFPNSQREAERLPFKLFFCEKFHEFSNTLRSSGKPVILCGDLNIAHKEIDLKNPKSNVKNAGFLPEERAWMTQFLASGYVDGFREFNPEPNHYTWWSYRPGLREKNIGWRIDYFLINQESRDLLKAVTHQPQVLGSDHCPVALELKE